MTNDLTPLVEFDDAALTPTNFAVYVATLRVWDTLHPSVNAVSLILEDDESTSAVWVDRTRAQSLVDALVARFDLTVTPAAQLRADDARDEALAEQTDTALLGPKSTDQLHA